MFLKTLTIAAVSLTTAMPALAQKPTPTPTPNPTPTVEATNSSEKAMVFTGKPCRTVMDDKMATCKELVITGLLSNTNSLNFHFKSGKNTSISYITTKKAVMAQGVSTYSLQGFYMRKADGKRSEIYAVTGSCKAANIPKNPEVECIIEGQIPVRSTYNKK